MTDQPLHILLVEDDPQLQAMYKRKFEHEQFSVSVAGTGKDALQALQDKKPNLILLDVMLPDEMNGFDILEHVKQNSETAHIPVVMFTNLSAEEEVAKQAGAAAYLVKAETSLEEVITVIKRILSLP